MTINIGLVTSDALVLGCDSVASTTDFFLDPLKIPWERNENGKAITDAEGRFSLKFKYSDFESIVTNAWGGVTKMFQVHPSPSPVVAVTAGLAKLRDRPIASFATEFLASHERRSKKLVNCKTICQHFLEFMRKQYDEHYKDSNLPTELRQGPEFLIGGHGRDDAFASLYRLNVQRKDIHEHFTNGQCGIAWNGQSDAVERFIRGYDSSLTADVEQKITGELKAYSDKVNQSLAETVNSLLDKLGQKLPEGTKVEVPKPPNIQLDWQQYRVAIEYSNLPLQEAVNLVSFLVNVQAGKGRFARGVATVGGRIHIGVVTKKGLEVLNEPAVTHRYTGFSDDQ